MAKRSRGTGGQRRLPARSTNPKDVGAARKVPLWSLPAIGAVHGAQATGDGIAKGYGAYNWREKPVSLMEMIGALERHIACLKDGEWYTTDTNPRVSHLGCLIAGSSIILDAQQCNTLIDDRPALPGRAGEELERYRRERDNGHGKQATAGAGRNRQRGRGKKAALHKR